MGKESTEERDRAVVAAYERGDKGRVIAEKFSLDRAVIYNILRARGVKLRQDPTERVERNRLIVEGYVAGATGPELAEKFSLSGHQIYKILHDEGVQIRTDRELLDKRDDRIVAAYEGGATLAELTEQFHLERTILYKTLHGRGVVIRNDPTKQRTYTVDEGVFDRITPESAYWVGFLMADGCVSDNGYLSLSLAMKDEEHVAKFREFLGSSHPIVPVVNHGFTESEMALLAISSKKLCAALARYGVVPRKTMIAEACADLAFNCDFWRGAVDGDGWVYWQTQKKSHGDYRVPVVGFTGTLRMCEQFRDWVASLADLEGHKPTIGPNNSIWKVTVTCRFAFLLSRVLYQGCSVALDRKQLVAQDILDSYKNRRLLPTPHEARLTPFLSTTLRLGGYPDGKYVARPVLLVQLDLTKRPLQQVRDLARSLGLVETKNGCGVRLTQAGLDYLAAHPAV